MSENPPAIPPDDNPPTDQPTPARRRKAGADLPAVGSVVKIGDRYALVVGSESNRHSTYDGNGDVTGSETREHPLVLDLPGVPRRHEAGTEKV